MRIRAKNIKLTVDERCLILEGLNNIQVLSKATFLIRLSTSNDEKALRAETIKVQKMIESIKEKLV